MVDIESCHSLPFRFDGCSPEGKMISKRETGAWGKSYYLIPPSFYWPERVTLSSLLAKVPTHSFIQRNWLNKTPFGCFVHQHLTSFLLPAPFTHLKRWFLLWYKNKKEWTDILTSYPTKVWDEWRKHDCSAVLNCPEHSQGFGMQLSNETAPRLSSAGRASAVSDLHQRSETNVIWSLWSLRRKAGGLCTPTPRFTTVIRRWGKVRQENQRDGVTENFLRLLHESGWGQSGEHARVNGAAKPKLTGVS